MYNNDQARKEIVEITTSKTSNEEEEDEEEAVHPDKQLSLHGSLGPKYGGGNDLFHSQFDLHTREQKISQVVLVKVGKESHDICISIF